MRDGYYYPSCGHGEIKVYRTPTILDLQIHISDNLLEVLDVSFLLFSDLNASMVKTELISSALDLSVHPLIPQLLDSFLTPHFSFCVPSHLRFQS